MVVNLLVIYERIADELIAVEIFTVHIHGGDLPILIGGVIIDATIEVTARRVSGDLPTVLDGTTSARLRDGVENVKKLSDAVSFTITAYRVHPCKRCTYKAGL